MTLSHNQKARARSNWVEYALFQVMDRSDLIFTEIVFVYSPCMVFQTELLMIKRLVSLYPKLFLIWCLRAYIENENGVLLACFPQPRSIQKRISSLWMDISK